MSEAPRSEHIETLGWIAAAAAGVVGACRAVLFGRKKPALSEEVISRIRREVLSTLRRESELAMSEMAAQMVEAAATVQAGVRRIERATAKLPDIEARQHEQTSELGELKADINQIWGAIRRWERAE